ncbi:MAG TPA: PmoA family protein [Candidatus Limnocylindria bacterium]|nr:PmoA family protein [Candidatus Limnocylindria bacterium]
MRPPIRTLSQGLGAAVLAWSLVGCQSTNVSGPTGASSGQTVSVYETNNVVRIESGGKVLADYQFRGVTRPFLYPLYGPDDVHITRRWPQEEFPEEEHDHPHHHGAWWAHGNVNGVDFWSEEPKAGHTVHQYFVEKRSGKGSGSVATRNRWVSQEGVVVAEDERRYTFYPPTEDLRVFDFSVTVYPVGKDLEFGDTKEGTFAIRIPESMRLKLKDGKKGSGHIVMPTGLSDGATWGTRSPWCDYTGTVEGKAVGIAIFDHPANPRTPTWWHVRDYGLFAANPFGLHDFEKKPAGAGNLKVPLGQTITFRYRVVLHRGGAEEAKVADRYAEYLSQKVTPSK